MSQTRALVGLTVAATGALLCLGALRLLFGALVHRRARGEQPHAAGRIGW